MDFIIFFSYSKDDNKDLKSMAIVKAVSQEEVCKKFKNQIDKEEYKDFHIWWVEELTSAYGYNDVIIP